MPNYYDPLSDMSRIKDSLMLYFCDSEDIVKIVMPKYDNNNFSLEQNWYGGTFDKNIYGETEVETLVGHCFDHPYIEDTVTDNRCAIFLETYLIRVGNQHIKEVGLDIFVVCHKDFIRLSEEERQYYHSIGVYGNRVDSAIQLINSAILASQAMEHIKKRYSIGTLNLIEKNPLRQYVPNTKFYGKSLSYTYQTFYQRKNNIKQG